MNLKLIVPALAVALGAVLVTNLAYARYNGEDRGKPVMPAQTNAKWAAECGSCHMAYPPGLMSAPSWKKVMGGLDKHFGADASLDAATTQEITGYLTAHPSNRWTASTAPLRITDAQWFKAKHGELAAEVWKRPAVKSASNCNACHQGAERGTFDENATKIPR